MCPKDSFASHKAVAKAGVFPVKPLQHIHPPAYHLPVSGARVPPPPTRLRTASTRVRVPQLATPAVSLRHPSCVSFTHKKEKAVRLERNRIVLARALVEARSALQPSSACAGARSLLACLFHAWVTRLALPLCPFLSGGLSTFRYPHFLYHSLLLHALNFERNNGSFE